MSLFDLAEKKEGVDRAVVFESAAAGELINAASLKQFKSLLSKLATNHEYHYWTGGQWSLHELAAYLITITGPVKLYLTTWAMTEDPVRIYIEHMSRGLITELHCIFDHKIREQKSKAFMLAENNFTSVTLAHCHAKVMVLRNDKWGISIPTSANQTRNPRIEYGIVCTDPLIADGNISYIEAIKSGQAIFKVRK